MCVFLLSHSLRTRRSSDANRYTAATYLRATVHCSYILFAMLLCCFGFLGWGGLSWTWVLPCCFSFLVLSFLWVWLMTLPFSFLWDQTSYGDNPYCTSPNQDAGPHWPLWLDFHSPPLLHCTCLQWASCLVSISCNQKKSVDGFSPTLRGFLC